MKAVALSNCEKNFLLEAINEGIRLDGRKFEESRPLKIRFGTELGSCYVSLGDTKVVSHVSCKIEQPKQAKPNEGLLFINLDLGSMAAPNFDSRSSELCVSLNRLIEKCIIDSRCVDLESLCIVSEEKVWSLRVDVHVINHAGNIIECASVAACASLSHFKRPDVTTNGGEITVHPPDERDPIPIVLHHYPVCVLFAFFTEEIMIADPGLLEETVCSSTGALFTIGMNSYREVCLFNLAGAAITLGPVHIYKASRNAAQRAKILIDIIKDALAEDERARINGEDIGFPDAICKDKITTLACEKLSLRLNRFNIDTDLEMPLIDNERNSKGMTVASMKNVAALLPENFNTKGKQAWARIEDESDNSNEDDEIAQDDSSDIRIIENKMNDVVAVSSDSEEEEVVVLNSNTKLKSNKTNRK